MKFEINQRVYLLQSRGGQLVICTIDIDRIELSRRGPKESTIIYSGMLKDGDGERETMQESRLFGTYVEMISEIKNQVDELTKKVNL